MPLQVVIAGGSGFLGTHLRAALGARGHEVVALVRRPASGSGESSWDPYAATYDRDVIETADVVVNLAGSPTAGNVHSKKWARELRQSRVRTTATLAEAISSSDRRPTFLAGNAIGVYGDHGDEVVTEQTKSRGDALLTTVCREWEAATGPAVDAGARVCVLRTSPVMDRRTPPLKQLRLLFKLGLGGRLGDGRQFMPMISLRDWLGCVVHLAEQESTSGPFNLVCPAPPTNAEFTKELARQLGRPAVVRAPASLVRVGAAGLAPELLSSVNARPVALEDAGYEFRDRDVVDVLRAGLSDPDAG